MIIENVDLNRNERSRMMLDRKTMEAWMVRDTGDQNAGCLYDYI